MDTSEYTKKFANDVARTGVGFETNFYSSMATGKINARDARYSSAMRKKLGGRVERNGKPTGVPGLARCSRTIGRKRE